VGDSEQTPSSYADQLWVISRITAPAIAQAVEWAGLAEESHGLDAGCGAGCHLEPLARAVGPPGRLTALDISPENLARARESWGSLTTGCRTGSRAGGAEPVIPTSGAPGGAVPTGGVPGGARPAVDFALGDIRRLPFDDDTFDWVWCADTLWPGRIHSDPVAIVAEFGRVSRPGGKVCLLYWSGQTLLPGYPILEARLNAGFAEWAPYYSETQAEAHHLRAQTWLRQAGLKQLQARTFLAEVRSPIDPATREALAACYAMFWEELEGRVSAADRQAYERLCRPTSPDFIADIPDYYAFMTYTLFSGVI